MSSLTQAPFFSIVVPVTDENVHLLSFTLDSIHLQVFDACEVIVIDGRAKEQALDIFETYRSAATRIYTALDRNLSAMLNKGVDLSQGQYVHFLQPGEYYISRLALRFLREFISQISLPDLICTGCIVRHSLSPPQQFFKQIEEEDLKGAKAPQGLQSYWFKKEAILSVGKLRTRYQIQGGFDLICRLYRKKSLRKIFMRRILTDYEYRLPKPKWIIRQLMETLVILMRHFGLNMAVLFWIAQNTARFFRWWSKSIKGAFWKGSAV